MMMAHIAGSIGGLWCYIVSMSFRDISFQRPVLLNYTTRSVTPPLKTDNSQVKVPILQLVQLVAQASSARLTSAARHSLSPRKQQSCPARLLTRTSMGLVCGKMLVTLSLTKSDDKVEFVLPQKYGAGRKISLGAWGPASKVTVTARRKQTTAQGLHSQKQAGAWIPLLHSNWSAQATLIFGSMPAQAQQHLRHHLSHRFQGQHPLPASSRLCLCLGSLHQLPH